MCTFLNTLPKKSKSAGTAKRKSLVLSIKPCPTDKDGKPTWYRFRLLNFAGQGTDRDYPFIERFIHQRWKINDKGYPEIEDEVTCPVTKWVDWEGNRYDGCPICRYANQQFMTLKESNWTDADARKKNRDFGRKYQAIIPVYVVSDPNYEGNNGKFKVIIFGDKKVYDAFVKKVEAQLLKTNCFNGVNAVDCCIHMTEVPEVRNEGKPNEYVYKNKVIDKITFTKDPKNIGAITKEAIDNFQFDSTYYVSSTKDELQEFYDKYIRVSNDDIIDDDDAEIKVFDNTKTETNNNIKIENPNVESEQPVNDLVNDLSVDLDEIGLDVKTPKPSEKSDDTESNTDDVSDAEMADMINSLDLD